MPAFRNVSIAILVDGKERKEQGLAILDNKIVTVNILGNAGQTFLYEYTNDMITPIMIYPTFDGHQLDSVYCAGRNVGHDQGICTSETDLHPFKFTELPPSVEAGILEFRVCRIHSLRFPPYVPHVNDTNGRDEVLADSVYVPDGHPWERPPVSLPTETTPSTPKKNADALRFDKRRAQSDADAEAQLPSPPVSTPPSRDLRPRQNGRAQLPSPETPSSRKMRPKRAKPSNTQQASLSNRAAPKRSRHSVAGDKGRVNNAGTASTGTRNTLKAAAHAKRAHSPTSESNSGSEIGVDDDSLAWELRQAEADAAVARAEQRVVHLRAEMARRKGRGGVGDVIDLTAG
ncbi:hypothetical protein WOLCODRAFT_146691 [Wolfiporia cocos MD-104 SS10]|uniref:Uncharacterized protein n=1 Tax=Wolfiporia cocos (strain MD-104) TaxID=742152 RepID=A0A2H3J5L3_WOLCO|nr:hypothetical protein WOLCODRAFT_146691 [Wolfiporia cocos MD-104 SS10]